MKIKRSTLRNSRAARLAYTLAEVLVGTAIMGTTFVSLYAGMSAGFAVTQAARENLRATQILLERMEGIRLYNWNQLVYSNMIPTEFTNYYYPLVTTGEAQGIPYYGKLTLSNAALSPTPSYSSDMRLVTVSISWTNGVGTNKLARNRQMQTYVGRNGLQNYIYSN